MKNEYQVKIKTPLGLKKGELTLIQEGETVSGFLILKNQRQPIKGQIKENKLTFAGEMNSPVGLLKYSCEAFLTGNTLEGTIQSSKGTVNFSGLRKETSSC